MPVVLNEQWAFFMNFWVYVLYSNKADRLYIGMTSNLEARMLSHNVLGKKGFTVRYRPWDLIYSETFDSKVAALERERQLKSGAGRAWIRSNYIDNL